MEIQKFAALISSATTGVAAFTKAATQEGKELGLNLDVTLSKAGTSMHTSSTRKQRGQVYSLTLNVISYPRAFDEPDEDKVKARTDAFVQELPKGVWTDVVCGHQPGFKRLDGVKTVEEVEAEEAHKTSSASYGVSESKDSDPVSVPAPAPALMPDVSSPFQDLPEAKVSVMLPSCPPPPAESPKLERQNAVCDDYSPSLQTKEAAEAEAAAEAVQEVTKATKLRPFSKIMEARVAKLHEKFSNPTFQQLQDDLYSTFRLQQREGLERPLEALEAHVEIDEHIGPDMLTFYKNVAAATSAGSKRRRENTESVAPPQ